MRWGTRGVGPEAGTEWTMHHTNPRDVVAILSEGTEQARRELAAQLLSEADQAGWDLLVTTIRSDASWLLRARCLEALGSVAANGSSEVARAVLHMLLGSPAIDDAAGTSP